MFAGAWLAGMPRESRERTYGIGAAERRGPSPRLDKTAAGAKKSKHGSRRGSFYAYQLRGGRRGFPRRDGLLPVSAGDVFGALIALSDVEMPPYTNTGI